MSSLLGGGNAGASQLKQANKLMQDNIAKLEAIGVPTVEAQKIVLQSPELAGLLQAEQVDGSAFDEVSADPRIRQAQLSALDEMAGLAKTGLGAADKSAFNTLRRDAAAQAQSQNAGVLQDTAQRGMLDSGSTLAAQLNAGQSQANRVSQEGDRLAANAAEARKAAIMNQANMAGNIRGQDYTQQAAQASARDTINQFNAQNRQSAGGVNLQNKQNIENQRAANANTQEQYNKGLVQQNFQNQITKATGVNNANSNLANNLTSQGNAAAQAQANQQAALLGLAGTAATAGLGYAGTTAAAEAAAKAKK